jgi:hypothetical protein
LVVLALGLWAFKKKPVEGSVEVGEGSFGKFGTDGTLDDLDSTDPTTETVVSAAMKSSIIPNKSKVVGFDDSYLKVYERKDGGNGCCA